MTALRRPQQGEFTLTLLSNSSLNSHPENTVYNFTNDLGSEIDFPAEERWKVCLHSITIPTSISDYTDRSIDEQIKSFQLCMANIVRERTKKHFNLFEEPDFKRMKGARNTALQYYDNYYKMLIEHTNKFSPIIVECAQIKSIFEENVVLAVIPMDWKSELANEKKFMVYEPKTLEYFDIASQYLRHIKITIRNSAKEIFETDYNQPVLVRLKFKRMDRDEADFHTVRISSNGSSPLNFNAALPEGLLTVGEQNPWEVALVSASFIAELGTFDCYSNECAIYCRVYQDDQSSQLFRDNAWSQSRINEEVRAKRSNFTSPKLSQLLIDEMVGRFEEIDDEAPYTLKSIKTIIPVLRTADSFAEFFKEIVETLVSPPIVRLESDTDINKYVRISVTKNPSDEEKLVISSNHRIFFYLPSILLLATGFNPTHVVGDYSILEVAGVVPATRKIDLKLVLPQNLMLYCDCVEASIVGDVFGQYLTHIPLKQTHEGTGTHPYYRYSPSNLEYHNVSTNDLSNINFKLLKTDGKLPKLLYTEEDGNVMYMTLQFRRKKTRVKKRK